jgi:hypothetical protein
VLARLEVFFQGLVPDASANAFGLIVTKAG